MSTLETTESKHLYLADAILCLNCDTVYDVHVHKECPVCTGRHHIKLMNVLHLMGYNNPFEEKA